MAKGGKINKISAVILFFLGCFFQVLPVRAGELSQPPHLIQSVSAEDIYEGMAALGLAHCPVLEEPDLEAALENVKDSVVRIDMGKAYGSGVIFRMTAEGAVIATNRHVLAYWREETGVIRFPEGYYAGARVLGSSESCDVGFLLVEKEALGLPAISGLRTVFVDEGVYAGLREGEAVFVLGAGREEDETIFQEALLEDTGKYIETFGGEMLYGRGFAREGMSGGGIFDSYGRLIGLLAGGTDQNEIAGVPVDQAVKAYREITGD
ncbi:MAG: serine protease [Lachnospiraceae bacterium]|nr:serine protease [Lachnospiraceae bacterium]